MRFAYRVATAEPSECPLDVTLGGVEIAKDPLKCPLEDGVPVALYTSVTYPGSPQKEGPNDASFVLMQGVRKA